MPEKLFRKASLPWIVKWQMTIGVEKEVVGQSGIQGQQCESAWYKRTAEKFSWETKNNLLIAQ